jgi:hypothetical protein
MTKSEEQNNKNKNVSSEKKEYKQKSAKYQFAHNMIVWIR